ncbi:hypothetical protein V1523DRAFT_437089 [Lipomyces doorenjongii]
MQLDRIENVQRRKVCKVPENNKSTCPKVLKVSQQRYMKWKKALYRRRIFVDKTEAGRARATVAKYEDQDGYNINDIVDMGIEEDVDEREFGNVALVQGRKLRWCGKSASISSDLSISDGAESPIRIFNAASSYKRVAFTVPFLFIKADLPSCLATQAQPPPSDGRRPAIPNIVHYVHLMSDPQGKIQFELKHFISIYSASLYFDPDVIYIHTDAPDAEVERAKSSDEASNKWSRLIFNLPKVVVNNETAPDYADNGEEIRNLENKSDFVRAKVVYELGGIYLDWDVHALRDFKPLREAGFANVVGLQKDNLVNSGCYMAIKESEMMRIWL